MDIEKIILHFKESSNEDYKTMLNLYESKSYNWALFIGHISIEKLLKAVFVKINKEHAPYTHNLLRLAELSKIELSDEYSDWLDKITSFNINARYDDYKKEFYKQCTPDFTKDWIDKINKLRTWINQML
ncbi:MAG: HEPN domain-containing protein [Ignavibacteriae bacterium]|nr:HEPN domain-containing protein [Ignavibacteriota bacterium]